jgi:hypothetical protein
MGSLSTIATVRDPSATRVSCSGTPGSVTAGRRTAEACQGPVDEDDGSGPCVVCGRPTREAVRPMGRITDPIWCCHAHDDRSIVRAWIHTLPEWQQLQIESPSPCAVCASPCHCAERESVGHHCACWPPSLDHRALVPA